MKKSLFIILLATVILSSTSCKTAPKDKTSHGTMPDIKSEAITVEQVPIEDSEAEAILEEPGVYDKHSSLTFSRESGFYDGPFKLSISAPEGYRVFYTLDGSIPTKQSKELVKQEALMVKDRSLDPNVYSMVEGTTTGSFYAPAILIDKATILRVKAYDANDKEGPVVTKSYFVDYQNKDDYYSQVAVISLVTSPDNLYDYDTGIYVTGATFDNWRNGKNYDPKTRYWHQPANYKNSGRDWERPAHMDFFESGNELAFSEELGMRVRGGASRAFLQKGFNIYARGDYGSKSIKYELFPELKSDFGGKPIKKYDSFMLRNGGNDTELTKIREVLHHKLSAGLNFSVQASRPVVLFLNGEFWGLYQLQEKYSEDYIEAHYGIDKDDVIIVEKDKLEEGEEADFNLYNTMLDYVTDNDLSDPAKYEEFSSMMDIDSLIDYVCVEIYVGNKDWGSNNVMLWRSRTAKTSGANPYEDGRWRFMMYDTEYSSGLSYENSLAFDVNYNPSRVTDDNFQIVLNPNSTMGKIFSSVIKNDAFQKRFKARFLEIAESVFDEAAVVKQIEAYADEFRPMMVDTLMRYRSITEDKAIKQFDYEVNKLKNYYKGRYVLITTKLNNYFP